VKAECSDGTDRLRLARDADGWRASNDDDDQETMRNEFRFVAELTESLSLAAM